MYSEVISRNSGDIDELGQEPRPLGTESNPGTFRIRNISDDCHSRLERRRSVFRSEVLT
jgi:hypothetical protein